MITRQAASASPFELDFAVNAAIVLLAVSSAAAVWLVVKALRGRRWARAALTAYLILAMIVLLWLSAPSRRFFGSS